MHKALKTSFGFSLIEILLVFAIMAIVALIATPYLSGSKQKAELISARDRLMVVLEQAQQQSIAASEGLEYSVTFKPNESTYVYQPEGKTYELGEGLSFLEPANEATVSFSKLLGKPSEELVITIASSKFKGDITIESQGGIVLGSIERR